MTTALLSIAVAGGADPDQARYEAMLVPLLIDRGRCVIRETWAHDDAVADEMEAIIEDAVVA